MPITFTNKNVNYDFTINTNSNELSFSHHDTKLAMITSDSVDNISNLVSIYENLNDSAKLDKENIYGQIKYIDLEGGFYGVVTESSDNYLPINLQDKLKKFENHYINITRSFTNDDTVSIYMWGQLIYATSYGIIRVEKAENKL